MWYFVISVPGLRLTVNHWLILNLCAAKNSGWRFNLSTDVSIFQRIWKSFLILAESHLVHDYIWLDNVF